MKQTFMRRFPRRFPQVLIPAFVQTVGALLFHAPLTLMTLMTFMTAPLCLASSYRSPVSSLECPDVEIEKPLPAWASALEAATGSDNAICVEAPRAQPESQCKTCGSARPGLESSAMKLILNSVPQLDRELDPETNRETNPKGQACKGIWSVPTVKSISSTAQLYSIIQDRLGSGSPLKKQPLALLICKPVLEKGRGYSKSEDQTHTPCASASDSFAVTVSGSRRDTRTGNCSLKVKNQSKQSCQGYSPEWPCKNGELWLDIEALGRNSLKAVYLP